MPTASAKDSPATSGNGHKATARAAGGRAEASSRSGDQRLTTARRSSRTATSASFQPEPAPVFGRAKLVTRERTAQTVAGRARRPSRRRAVARGHPTAHSSVPAAASDGRAPSTPTTRAADSPMASSVRACGAAALSAERQRRAGRRRDLSADRRMGSRGFRGEP